MAKKRRSSQFKDSSQVIDIEEARKKRQEKRNRQHKMIKAGHSTGKKPGQRASITQNKRRRTIIYTAIVVSIIAVVGISTFNIVSLKQEQNEIKKQQQLLQEEKAEKQQELKNINDPDYIEEQARAQLRLVLPGEKIYVFPDLDESDEETSTKNEDGNAN